MSKQSTTNGAYTWVDVLTDLLKKYNNNTVHSTNNMKLINVNIIRRKNNDSNK